MFAGELAVAFSLLAANSASPEDGLLALASLGEENSIATVTSTNPLTGAKTITSAQFASKFAILDSLAEIDVAMPSERWPLPWSVLASSWCTRMKCPVSRVQL